MSSKGKRVSKSLSVNRNEKGPLSVSVRKRPDQRKVAEVKNFLQTLNNISQTLSALGYQAAGNAVAQVQVDLHNRLFWSSESRADILKMLH